MVVVVGGVATVCHSSSLIQLALPPQHLPPLYIFSNVHMPTVFLSIAPLKLILSQGQIQLLIMQVSSWLVDNAPKQRAAAGTSCLSTETPSFAASCMKMTARSFGGSGGGGAERSR